MLEHPRALDERGDWRPERHEEAPHLALAMYAKAMDRRDGEPERLRALVQGVDWAPAGTSPVETTSDAEFAPAS